MDQQQFLAFFQPMPQIFLFESIEFSAIIQIFNIRVCENIFLYLHIYLSICLYIHMFVNNFRQKCLFKSFTIPWTFISQSHCIYTLLPFNVHIQVIKNSYHNPLSILSAQTYLPHVLKGRKIGSYINNCVLTATLQRVQRLLALQTTVNLTAI